MRGNSPVSRDQQVPWIPPLLHPPLSCSRSQAKIFLLQAHLEVRMCLFHPISYYLSHPGIGAACAVALAEAGASICLVLREGSSPSLAMLNSIQALHVKVEV